MRFNRLFVTGAVLSLAYTTASAEAGVPIKLSRNVTETIKMISVNVEPAIAGNIHMASFTYEAPKACRTLSIFGHAYTKDNIQQGVFQVGSQMDVTTGQKFKDEATFTMDPGGFIAVDKASCL